MREMEYVKAKVGFKFMLAVDCEGSDDTEISYTISGVYGHPEEANKFLTFQLLRQESSNKWICFGDLNAICSQEEKQGGRVVSFSQAQEFRGCLQLCCLVDVGFHGHQFTWSNGREGEQLIQQRLDRCCATAEALQDFPTLSVVHPGKMTSDHCPLRITWSRVVEEEEHKKERLFRFERVWIDDQRFNSCIAQAWNRPGAQCTERIEATKQHLYFLDKEVGSHCKQIRVLEKKLKEAEAWSPTAENIAKRKALLEEYDEVLRLDELYWQQRSRALWLKEGDKNTKFFHEKASMRQKYNKISKLKNANGEWIYGQKGVGDIVQNYFTTIFDTSCPQGIDEVCAVVRDRLDTQMKASLEAEYSPEEVKTTLFQMHPLKSPGPDGFPALFYQQYWDIVDLKLSTLLYRF